MKERASPPVPVKDVLRDLSWRATTRAPAYSGPAEDLVIVDRAYHPPAAPISIATGMNTMKDAITVPNAASPNPPGWNRWFKRKTPPFSATWSMKYINTPAAAACRTPPRFFLTTSSPE